MMSIVLLLVIVVRATAFAKDSISSSEESNVISDLTLSIPKSWNVLIDNKIIVFDSNLTSVKLLRCYCLTSDTSALQPQLNIGHCFYGCFYHTLDDEYHLSSWSVSDETSKCSLFNREGILCGQCKEGYGSPVYSFSLKCVPCSNVSLWTTIPLYILVAYGPLTVFLVVIVVFTVSVNSAPLHGWILVCQLMSSSMVMRILISTEEIHSNSGLSPHVQIFGSVYGVWNLDFFRAVYKPFCLHHSLTTLQVMSLDYIIAAYPLVMILAMYVMVDLYSRNCRPVVIVGRLFHHCCIRFRHRLNVRTSLIDTFGTFFSLSYIKFLSTTVDLLMSTHVWSTNNTISQHVYFDGTKELFKGDYIPYGVVGVSVAVLCNTLPIILLLLYSSPKTHTILNILPLSVRTLMFPFMDNILGCYKDGTNGTRNCRFFAVVYHFALFGYLLCFLCLQNAFILGLNCYVSIIVGMLVAVIQPYKSKVYNTVDIILILSVGLCFAGNMSSIVSYIEAPFQKVTGVVMAVLPFAIPFFYMVGYIFYKICQMSLYFSWVCHFLKRSILQYRTRAVRIIVENNDVTDSAAQLLHVS